MNNKAIESEILNLENQYWQAMKNKDLDTALSLTRFPCMVSGPHGAKSITEKDYRNILRESNPDKYQNVEIKNAQIDVLNESTAVIAYQTRINSMDLLDVSTWIKENGKWICAFHSENPLSMQ